MPVFLTKLSGTHEHVADRNRHLCVDVGSEMHEALHLVMRGARVGQQGRERKRSRAQERGRGREEERRRGGGEERKRGREEERKVIERKSAKAVDVTLLYH